MCVDKTITTIEKMYSIKVNTYINTYFSSSNRVIQIGILIFFTMNKILNINLIRYLYLQPVFNIIIFVMLYQGRSVQYVSTVIHLKKRKKFFK